MKGAALIYDKETWRSGVDNGQIPLSKLAEVYPYCYDRDLGGPALMHPEPAAAMSTMLQAAAEQGFPDLAVSLSYRTYAMQIEKYANYQAGGNLAAKPGTSNHGWAVSADMRWGRAVTLAWLQVNAPLYGFIADVTGENWHYTFQEGMWNGDDMTEGQLKQLGENTAYRNGQLWLDEHWTLKEPDPAPPKDRQPAFYAGVRVLKRAYNRPRVT